MNRSNNKSSSGDSSSGEKNAWAARPLFDPSPGEEARRKATESWVARQAQKNA